MDEIDIRRLTRERLDDFLDFFDHRAFVDNREWSGCYCFFPYHDPAVDGAWSSRSAAQNRAAISTAIEAGTASGFLAYAGERVIGWCNAAPRSAFPSLRSLPGDGTKIGATPCFIVDPEWRGRGVAHKLLAVACQRMQADGMEKMEAGPNKNAESDSENCRGPLSMYEAAGYRVVREFPDGTVAVAKVLG